jgi:hypothetical protein
MYLCAASDQSINIPTKSQILKTILKNLAAVEHAGKYDNDGTVLHYKV